MQFQGLGIVFALVAEQLTIAIELVRVADQTIPIIMADFMTKMTEKRTIFFGHRMATTFPFRVIGLGHIDRDQAFFVTSEYRLGVRRIADRVGKKREGQTSFGVIDL